MGFLDHSTNNIIVDAVLTDLGRKKLAESNLNIDRFCLGDDEIDYTIIQQFGRNVGKEKIEKNTPVLEAFTQNNLGQRFKLSSIPNEVLLYLPVMTVDATNNLLNFDRKNINTSQTVAYKIKNTESDMEIPVQIADSNIYIDIDRKFLTLAGAANAINIDRNNIARYRLGTSRDNAAQISFSLNISLKSISQKDFQKYSIPSGAYIRTFVKVTGVKSGIEKIIEVRIS